MSKLQVAEKVFNSVTNGIKEGKTVISCQGSSRSAKSYNILIYLVLHCLQHKETRLSIVRKTLPALKGSILIDFKEIMMKLDIWDDKQFNKTELIYRFSNGSWIEFFSTDNEQKIRGRKRQILFVNEANELNELEWQQLVMRTSLFSIIDYNPSFSEDHWIEGVNNDCDTLHFISTYKDNPFLEQKIIDDIEKLKDKNKSLWTVYGLGLRAVIEGRIFERFEIVDKIPEWIKWRRGCVDYGYSNDPTAMAEVAIYEQDIYIDEFCYRTKMLTGEIIHMLKSNAKELKIISECADPRMIDEIHNAGLNIHAVSKPAGSVNAGIDKMNEYNIKITRRSFNAIKEFSNYVYQQDKDGKWLNIPVDINNHIIDAVRYVVLNEVLGKNRKKVNMNHIMSGFR
jgi:phage terminase large subunit